MQAFILAAGLGTRLKPLTNTRPKALIKVGDKTLLETAIENLTRHGVTRIVVNVHHFADMMIQYLTSNSWDAEIVISDEREQLLDTGGGLKKASGLLRPNEPIIAYNVDILSRINIRELVSYHTDSMNLVTLCVSQRDTSRYLLFNGDKQLTGWQNQSTKQTKWVGSPSEQHTALAFSGISVINPQLFPLLPVADHAYPIIPEYIRLAKHHRISYFKHDKSDWLDVGKVETLAIAQTWTI